MSRQYTDVEALAEEMIRDPRFHGIAIWRENPCCSRDRLRVAFNQYQLDRTWDIEDAAVYLEAMERTMKEYRDRFAADPNDTSIETMSYPCGGCVMEGYVEEEWMALNGETIESLQAGLIR